MFTLIIPTYKNPDYLDVCLRSAVENKARKDTEIIVVVDGFYEQSAQVLSKYEGSTDNLYVMPLQQNQGMATAINYGVGFANQPWVFIVNDDNVMPENWDTRLKYEIEKSQELLDHDRFSLAVTQVEPTGPSMFNHTIENFGNTVNDFRYDDWKKEEWELCMDMINTTGNIFPFAIQKKYYMACGGLDTFYQSPNVCDWDFFLKLELLGFVGLRTYNMNLYHFGSVVTKKNEDRNKFSLQQASAFERYKFKWGAHPYNEVGSNSKIPADGKFRGFSI